MSVIFELLIYKLKEVQCRGCVQLYEPGGSSISPQAQQQDIAFRFNITECDISKVLRSLAPCYACAFKASHQVVKQACNIKEYAKMF